MMWEYTIDPLTNRSQLLNEFVADLSFWGPLLEVSKPLLKKVAPKQQRQALQQHTLQQSSMSDASSRSGKPMWRTAVDATSGKTYYYDAITRRTQWEKPVEIREMERRRRQARKMADKIFFASMEQNIRDSLNRGEIVPGVLLSDYQAGATRGTQAVVAEVPVANVPPIQQQQQPQQMQLSPPIRSRTISGMDENMLQELNVPAPVVTAVVPKSACLRRDSHGRPPLPRNKIMETYRSSTMSLELSPENSRTEKSMIATLSPPLLPENSPVHPLTREESDQTELRGEALLDVLSDEEPYDADFVKQQQLPVQQPVQHVRRNTGTTIYAASTMMNPDVEKTIKCVCGVYRAHIAQASSKRSKNSPVTVAMLPNQSLAAIFSDTYGTVDSGDTDIPSLDEIIAFYQDFYVRSQMEHDTIIMSLIYVERLIKEDTTIAPLPNNWRSVLFSCMVLASKVWDDLSMWNIDFSNVCGRGGGLTAYTLPRINQLELALLKALNFNVKVPASEYAKYYFLIRSMLLKSGLLSEESPTITPKKQQQPAAALAQRTNEQARHRGTRSMNDYMWMEQKQQVGSSVCLEQLMAMTTY